MSIEWGLSLFYYLLLLLKKNNVVPGLDQDYWEIRRVHFDGKRDRSSPGILL